MTDCNIKKATSESLYEAAALMRKGEVIIFGSDGVYAMSCSPFIENAVKNLSLLKKRNMSNAYQIVVDPRDIDKYALLNDRQQSIIWQLLPDAVSFIVANRAIPSYVVGSLETICIGWQDSWIVQCLYKYLGGPYIGTSANLHGQQPALTVEQAVEYFGNKIALYIDSGPARIGVANTIVDLTTEPMRCLREGVYSLEDIRQMLKEKGL